MSVCSGLPWSPGPLGGSVRDRQKISASSWRFVRLVPGIDGWRRASLSRLPREAGQTSGRPLHRETELPCLLPGFQPLRKCRLVMRPRLRVRQLLLCLVVVTRVCTRWSPNLVRRISCILWLTGRMRPCMSVRELSVGREAQDPTHSGELGQGLCRHGS